MIFWRYRAHLEAELVKQELLLKALAAEKERHIHLLSEENKRLRARVDRLELALTPAARTTEKKEPFKETKVPIEAETSWITYLNRTMKAEEELIEKEKQNVQVKVGTRLHEPASGDASRPDVGDAPAAT